MIKRKGDKYYQYPWCNLNKIKLKPNSNQMRLHELNIIKTWILKYINPSVV